MTRRFKDRTLDPETCVAQGGHCWERSNFVTATIPPVYTETCKHCPAYREGTPREAMEWTKPQLPRRRPDQERTQS